MILVALGSKQRKLVIWRVTQIYHDIVQNQEGNQHMQEEANMKGRHTLYLHTLKNEFTQNQRSIYEGGAHQTQLQWLILSVNLTELRMPRHLVKHNSGCVFAGVSKNRLVKQQTFQEDLP